MARLAFSRRFTAASVLVFATLAVPAAKAQQPRGAAAPRRPEEILRVRELTGVGTRDRVKTPVFSGSRGQMTRRDWLWVQIETEYDTAPEWIDELTFRYYALAQNARVAEGEPRFSLYKTVVRYVDIEAGRGHRSAVFLHPSARKRFGDLVGVAVEVVHDGNVIAEESAVQRPIPEDWWQRATLTKSDQVVVRDGYLLDRSKTPFAMLAIDDYEVIR